MKKFVCVLMAAVLLLATGCSSNSTETEDNTATLDNIELQAEWRMRGLFFPIHFNWFVVCYEHLHKI